MKQQITTGQKFSIVILLLILIAAVVLGLYAWARYTTSISGEAEAQVAKWHFDLTNTAGTSLSETEPIDLAETIDFEHVASKRIAPGTYGLFQMVVDTRGTEVDLLYEIEVALIECPTNLNFYTDSEHTNLISKEGNQLTFSEYLTHTQAINYYETINIYWNWPYETLDSNYSSEAGDAQDKLDQGRTVIMNIRAIGTQMLSKPVTLGTIKNGETTITNGGTVKLRVGDTTTLNVTEAEKVTYSSSDTAVATVDSNTGDIEAVATGNAVITITGKDSGRAITINVKVSSPISLEIGDTIKYTPSGTYNWDKELATSDETGIATLQSGTGQSYDISEWYVYGIEGDNVIIVPKATTSGTVKLQGAQGYNNAVKLLNDACSALYGNTGKGITARSINIEDFEKVMDNEELKTAQDSYGYNTQKYDSYTEDNQYPEIYALENKSVITTDGNTVENNSGLGLSEQTSFIYRTDNNNIGKITTAESIRPYQTYYDMSNYKLGTALGTTYKKVLLNNGTPNYWVASRCVYADTSGCGFRIRSVSRGTLEFYSMLGSGGYADYHWLGFFPVVSLSSNLLEETGTAGTYQVNLDK